MGTASRTFRWVMHGLAVLSLLVAIGSAVFWVRSRLRWDEVMYQQKSSVFYLLSVASRFAIGSDWMSLFRPGISAHTGTWDAAVEDAWTYTHVGWAGTGALGHYDFFGMQWYCFPAWRSLHIPFSYLLLFSLSFSGWWFWRVRRQRKPRHVTGCCKWCGYNLQAHTPGQKCPECGTPIP